MSITPEVLKYVDEKTLAQLIMLIIVINAWNRIAISCRLT